MGRPSFEIMCDNARCASHIGKQPFFTCPECGFDLCRVCAQLPSAVDVAYEYLDTDDDVRPCIEVLVLPSSPRMPNLVPYAPVPTIP